MPTGATMYHYVFVALLVLFTIAFTIMQIAQEVACRKAGPVRFRLGLASQADPSKRKSAYVFPAMMSCAVLFIIIIDGRKGWPYLPLFLPVIVQLLSQDAPRRDAKRWLVIASGLISLVSGAVFLAVGSGIIPTDYTFFTALPRAFWLAVALMWVVSGLRLLQEAISGTRVRERGIEIFGFLQPWGLRIVPWSRIIVKDWQAREGEFALDLTIVGGVRNFEFNIPVPASERAALEDFLAGHIATAA